MKWEAALIEKFLGIANETSIDGGRYELLFNVARSFEDVTSGAVGVDTIRMASGYLVMFAYSMFMLGKINRVEHRTYLALAGILACFFGLIISMGLTMAIGFYYTTIHGILPFMALGKTYSQRLLCTGW